MLDGRFSLPDIDGAVFESVMDEMIERMRPAKGQPCQTREHRGADALVELCHAFAARRGDDTATAPAPHLIVQVPMRGPATVAGIPLPDATVERLRAQAKVEPIAVGRVESTLSEKTKRVVRQRDGKCRWRGCDQRIGLEVHHLWPSSWGGRDELWNLATVCWTYHHQLATLAADHARAGPTAA